MTNSNSIARSTRPYSNHKILWLLFACWAMMQCFLFWKNGITTDGEAEKYIFEGRHLLAHGTVTSGNFWFYIVNTGLIALSLKLRMGFIFPVVMQLALNLAATAAFFKLCRQHSPTRPAIAVTILLILFYPYQQFNTFLQTESVYYSLIILYSCMLLGIKKPTITASAKVTLLLLLLTFTRPTGVLLIIPTYVFLFARFFAQYSKTARISIILATAGVFIIVLNSIMSSGGELNFLKPYIEEHIICGVPGISTAGLVIPEDQNTIRGLLQYLFSHPGQIFRLGTGRTVAFFGLYRSYFSLLHNAGLMIVFFGLYLAGLLSSRYWWSKNRSAFLFIITMIAVTWLTAFFTCDDWHNRFIIALFPLFLFLSLPALTRITKKNT